MKTLPANMIVVKKIIPFCLLLMLNVTVFSQTVTSPGSIMQTDYLKKSKNQKTEAWILLGGGTTLIIIGGALALHDFGEGLGNIFNPNPQPTHDNSTAAGLLAITGAASMLGSIPLFISASKNRHKAISITLKNDLVPELKNSSIIKVPLPEISLVVRF
jgi:hypothetical protein